MGYRCKLCGINEVSEPDGVCEFCSVSQDPYLDAVSRRAKRSRPAVVPASGAGQPDSADGGVPPRRGTRRRIYLDGSGGSSNPGSDGTAPEMISPDPAVQVYKPGQTVPAAPPPPPAPGPSPQPGAARTASGKQPLTSGISKNIQVDTQKRSALEKVFRAFFEGIPYLLDDQITMFQVFPDFSGSALNAQGNACDQIIVYGTLKAGAVSENNDVEVYGRRDSRNNIVAAEIRNKASGTLIRPERIIPAWVVRSVSAALLLAVFCVLAGLGVEGIVQIAILVFCLLNLPFVIRVFGALLDVLISITRNILR